MSVEDVETVDAIGVDRQSGDVILTIADHLAWDDDHYHLTTLQEKLNTYIAFVESGELVRVYPDAKDRNVMIDVVAQHKYPPIAGQFFERVREIVESVPVRFRVRVLDTGVQ